MEVLGLPNGVCSKPNHGARLTINGEPVCVKCKAEAERAQRTTILVNTAPDPGHDGMKRIAPGGEKTIVEVPVGGTAPLSHSPTVTAGKPVQASNLLAIREAIYRLPMPKSMSQYKRFLKIQQLIDQCVSEEENV